MKTRNCGCQVVPDWQPKSGNACYRKKVSAAVPVNASPAIQAKGTLGLPEKVEEWLVEAVGVLLKVKKADIDLDAELSEFGFDSISLTGFANHVNQTFGLKVMPTIFFEHATLKRFARHLSQEYGNQLMAKLNVQAAEVPAIPVIENEETAPQPLRTCERRKRRRARS